MMHCTRAAVCRYCTALKKAHESTAVRKYFEHTGALITADGTDDHLIRFEGVPKGEGFSWTDDPLEDNAAAELPTYDTHELEPPDVCPARIDPTAREGEDEDEDERIVDDDDEPDEGDAPPAPKEAPAGFRLADLPPPAEALDFCKGGSPADALIDRLLLFNWPVVGWCVGKITSRNTDARCTTRLADGATAKKNFNIFYEIDGEEVGSVLRADEYGGDEEFSWVMLEPVGSGGGSSPLQPTPEKIQAYQKKWLSRPNEKYRYMHRSTDHGCGREGGSSL